MSGLLLGGSADLTESNVTKLKGIPEFNKVRENDADNVEGG